MDLVTVGTVSKSFHNVFHKKPTSVPVVNMAMRPAAVVAA
jgi:hypothetical protein